MSRSETDPVDSAYAGSVCLCRNCPTYFDCGEKLAFCLYEAGASDCIIVNRGCVCPGCPVYVTAGFKLDLYCIAGSEEAQRDAKGAMGA